MPYISHCLQSLTEQGIDDYEVLLVNDASRDNSRGICSEWCQGHPKFRLINHTENKGLSEARNTGLREAQGEWVTFVDSDDYLSPLTFSSVFAALDKLSDEEIDVMEYPVMQNQYSASPHLLSFTPAVLDFMTWINIGGHRHCYACNKIFKRTLWHDKWFPQGRYFEDIFTIPYILKESRKILQTDTGLYYYCDRNGSISKRYTEACLYDYVEANNKLLGLPENRHNYDLYLRAKNGERSYNKIAKEKKKLVDKMSVPLTFAFSKGLSFHDRIKILYYACQTIV